ncbi:MAG: hypothetical protein Q9165_004590 [Trypethelium subeluteriae]
MKFTSPNGSIIQPIQVGEMPSKPSKRVSDLHQRSNDLFKRDSCSKWTADSGMQEYTRPSDNVTIVASGVSGGTGGSSVQITHERSQSWTTSISAGLSFDVFSANMEFSMTQEVSTSKAYTFNVPAGQSGNVGWTATLTCSTGNIECKDGTYHGEVCTPTSDGDEPAGIYNDLQFNDIDLYRDIEYGFGTAIESYQRTCPGMCKRVKKVAKFTDQDVQGLYILLLKTYPIACHKCREF